MNALELSPIVFCIIKEIQKTSSFDALYNVLKQINVFSQVIPLDNDKQSFQVKINLCNTHFTLPSKSQCFNFQQSNN